RYAGYYWDRKTQYYYLQARYYDPRNGRFLSADTFRGEIGNPLSLHLYAYSLNNPVNYVDPSGFKTISVYFLAGVGTWQSGDMFKAAKEDIIKRYQDMGYDKIHVADVYPYGTMEECGCDQDATKQMAYTILQALVVNNDMDTPYKYTVGGNNAFESIKEDYDYFGGGDIVLIGHSGGGIAAYDAAQLLNDAGYNVSFIVQVGSPKEPIKKKWRDKVGYIEKKGFFGDGITAWGMTYFQRPGYIASVDIVGGHPYYFDPNMKDDNGVSNLSKTMDQIWDWIKP
ncbi:RHS repeat-associated core domain-containing protein, partial [Ferviditalea candida]|nr:RHS repeat-associated core domain-containing protein [Paenibacillaceae bacterium T2]